MASKERFKLFAGIFFSCLVLILCVCTLSGCSQSSEEEKEKALHETLLQDDTLTVLTALDYPPFESGDAANPRGFDIALAQELAHRLDLSLEIVVVPRTLILALVAGDKIADNPEQYFTTEPKTDQEKQKMIDDLAQYAECFGDVGIAAFAITPERDDKVNFSDWYYVSNQAVVTLSGAYKATSEFNPTITRVGVVEGSVCSDTAKKYLTSDKLVVSYPSVTRCFEALHSGLVNAIVVDDVVAQHFIETNYSDCVVLEEIMTNDTFAVAVNEDKDPLKDALNEALEAMEEDGTLYRLQQTYLG